MASGISSLIVKIAERCNLNCSYCYMYNHEDTSFESRPAIMGPDIFDRLLDRINEHGRSGGGPMSLTFHGGEPTLVGRRRFSGMVKQARAVLGENLGSLSLQTNATLLTKEWVDLLRALDVHVGVSLDGPAAVHDAVRVDHFGRGSHDSATRGVRLLQDAGMDPGILCVVNPGHDGLATYHHFRELGVRRIAYLLPDVSHDNKKRFYGACGATPVADFLLPIFDVWFEDDDPAVEIHPFWAIMSLLLGGQSRTDDLGGTAMNYLVIETDGEIELLDALKVCAHGINNLDVNLADQGFDDVVRKSRFARELLAGELDLCQTCRSCDECGICGGGYLPHRYSRANGFDNPSVWCEDMKILIGHIRERTGAGKTVPVGEPVPENRTAKNP